MNTSGPGVPPKPAAINIAEVVALACLSAAMLRLQQTGDPFSIVWATGAIIVLTSAAPISRAVERRLSRLFGSDMPDDDDGNDEASGDRP
jgi:hypothetical protein